MLTDAAMLYLWVSLCVQDPLFVPQLMGHVGPAALADWMLHVGGLAAFSTFNAAGTSRVCGVGNPQLHTC